MNKYDDINTFLTNDSDIQADSEFLLSYISTFLYRSTNREKIDEFYKNIPAIFDKLFGISTKTNQTKQFNRFSSCIIDLLSSDKAKFEDLDKLLHVFIPLTGIKNLFSSAANPPDFVPDYILVGSIVSKSINSLINQRKQDYILSLGIFDELSKNIELQRPTLDKGNLMTTIFEYFIIIILIAMKELQFKSKVSLPKLNTNFKEFPKNYLNKKLFSEKSTEFLHSLDLNRSLMYNFYMTLFKNIFSNYMYSKSYNDQHRLRFIVSSIELVWLTDYFMIPSSSYISKSPFDIYSFFFKSSMNVNFTVNIPNIIMIDCLHHVVITLQAYNLLFAENPYNKTITLREDALIFKLQKPLFYFFKSLFLKFSEETTNSEVNLSDIGKIWFSYITPWFQTNTNVNYYSGSSRSNVNTDVLGNAMRDYVFTNLLFYTELFNDYIYAFSSLNVLSKYELALLNKVLELYKISSNDEIINDKVHLKVLDDLSQGKIYVYIPYII